MGETRADGGHTARPLRDRPTVWRGLAGAATHSSRRAIFLVDARASKSATDVTDVSVLLPPRLFWLHGGEVFVAPLTPAWSGKVSDGKDGSCGGGGARVRCGILTEFQLVSGALLFSKPLYARSRALRGRNGACAVL